MNVYLYMCAFCFDVLDVNLEGDPYALKLWNVEGTLNKMQQIAIERALQNKFHLIQGPPGYFT